MCRFVTIARFHGLTGYTEDAVRSKIKRGEWLQDVMWRKAPDGRVLMDMETYERWVQGDPAALEPPPQDPLSSTSTTAAYAAANG